MKVIKFSYFNKPKKQKKIKIFCVGNVFKTLCLVFSAVLTMLIINLVSGNFISNLSVMVSNFVESFV